MTVVWTILDAGYDSITATETAVFGSTPNSITVPGPRTVLYVSPGNRVAITADALPPKLRAKPEDIRYIMTDSGAGQAGSIGFGASLLVGIAGEVHDVTTYLDENLNDAFDSGEFSLTFTIRVVDFGSAKVHGGRVAGGVLYPGEDQLFIKPSELFDVTSTFKYSLVAASDTVLGDGALVRGQLIRTAAPIVIAAGAVIGTEFEVLLTSAMVGDAQVRFYLDTNFNGACDMGEPLRTSSPFEIVERNHLQRTFQYNIYFPISQAVVQAAVDNSFALALRKDRDDDYRAAVYCTVTPASTAFFIPDATRPDAANTYAKINLHFDAHKGITILSNGLSDPVDGSFRGYAKFNDTALAVDWGIMVTRTLLHEIGHNLGMEHNGLGPAFIMEKGPATGGTMDQLSFSEAAIYSATAASNSSMLAHPDHSAETLGKFADVPTPSGRPNILATNVDQSITSVLVVQHLPVSPMPRTSRSLRLRFAKDKIQTEMASVCVKLNVEGKDVLTLALGPADWEIFRDLNEVAR